MKKTKNKTKAVKLVSVYTDEETRKRLRVYCAAKSVPMTDVVTTALNIIVNMPEKSG